MIPFQTSRRALAKLINESTLRLNSGEILISIRKGKNEGAIDLGVASTHAAERNTSNLPNADARRPVTR